ncbi:BbrUII/HgiDII family restriction enzyme [Ferrimonas sediminicola]|nr:ATP-binding protein [Ferrimonas sediminicola]
MNDIDSAVQDQATEANKYRMNISLNVLKHLGINLYSNVAAVLTETVANGWDADAEKVEINLNQESDQIEISDDGCGMTVDDINKRFLMIGHDRRKAGYTTTPEFTRPVMGRKGLGKLSLFSIARKIRIYTVKDGQKNGFILDVDKIEATLKSGEDNNYYPEEIPAEDVVISKGTLIVLSDLVKSRMTSPKVLKKRLARRFTVISDNLNFMVTVNGDKVQVSDRDYSSKIEYLWTLGDQNQLQSFIDSCSNKKRHKAWDGIVDPQQQYIAEGWIGTVETSGQLKDNEIGNINGVVLMARGRVVHEDVLGEFNDGRLFTKYVIGEINADFLDLDDEQDIATSSRQSLIEDDPRYQQLKAYIQQRLNEIGRVWHDFRNEDGGKQAEENIGAIKEWLSELRPAPRKAARKLVGHIQGLPIDNESDRKELFKHGIIAFEKMRMKEQLDKLDTLTTFDAEQFKMIFDEVDELEAGYYHEIVTERLSIIKQLEKLKDDNALEVEMQKHIFQHLWLLDPSWERATSSERMEESLKKEFGQVTSLTEDEAKGRLDIRYQKVSGANVIIELKRQERSVSASELYNQGSKYHAGWTKCLQDSGQPSPYVEVIFLVGNHPSERRPGETDQLLSNINGRWFTYRRLIEAAIQCYSDYLKESEKVNRVHKILKKL